MDKSLKGIALCALGLEKTVSNELSRLGLEPGERSPGKVYFALGEKDLARRLSLANMGLRVAERVLIELGRFPAPDFDAFYEGVAALPWELCCFKDTKLHIERVRTNKSNLSAQVSLQSMGQKAAYASLMATYGMRTMPETGNIVSARIYLDDNLCSIGIDTSGEALHKRGYRTSPVEAPLKETIAAALLFLSGWNRKYPFYDPFCGSGTIAIEAALYALDFAPGLSRTFGFEAMPCVSARTVDEVRSELEARIRNDVEFEIRGSDLDMRAVEAARRNASQAGIADWLRFDTGRAEDASPRRERGFLISNPPYGKRLGTEEEAISLYQTFAPAARRYAEAGWGLGFITDREDFCDYLDMKPDSIRHIVNGAEEQWFHWLPGARPSLAH